MQQRAQLLGAGIQRDNLRGGIQRAPLVAGVRSVRERRTPPRLHRCPGSPCPAACPVRHTSRHFRPCGHGCLCFLLTRGRELDPANSRVQSSFVTPMPIVKKKRKTDSFPVFLDVDHGLWTSGRPGRQSALGPVTCCSSEVNGVTAIFLYKATEPSSPGHEGKRVWDGRPIGPSTGSSPRVALVTIDTSDMT